MYGAPVMNTQQTSYEACAARCEVGDIRYALRQTRDAMQWKKTLAEIKCSGYRAPGKGYLKQGMSRPGEEEDKQVREVVLSTRAPNQCKSE